MCYPCPHRRSSALLGGRTCQPALTREENEEHMNFQIADAVGPQQIEAPHRPTECRLSVLDFFLATPRCLTRGVMANKYGVALLDRCNMAASKDALASVGRNELLIFQLGPAANLRHALRKNVQPLGRNG